MSVKNQYRFNIWKPLKTGTRADFQRSPIKKSAVKKQKKRLHPEKERMQPFLWYNVIVKKQTPQEHYTAYQLKLPVEIEKIKGHL